MPDMTGTFGLMSDTSTLAVGAALYQYQGSAYYIVGYNSKKLPKAVTYYSVTELELFGTVVNIYAFKQLLTNIYFEVFCDHSAIVQILNGKKKIPTRRIQRLIEHLLPFNFTVQYLPGNKMHIADILSRLAGKDLEPSDQLIPISFNVYMHYLIVGMKIPTHKDIPVPPQNATRTCFFENNFKLTEWRSRAYRQCHFLNGLFNQYSK